MAGFSFDFSAFKQLSADLNRIAKQVQANERAAVMAAGMAYQHDVQAYPPPIDTGQYRASMRTEMAMEGLNHVALIGSPMPQARRLEFGFIGPDKLGRVYHQPPRPHWRPAWDHNLARYENILLERLAGGRT